MSEKRERIVVDAPYQLDYKALSDVVARCGGWIRSSGGGEGDTAEAWVDDKTYVFVGPGLIEFLYAAKDRTVGQVYEALNLCEYIEKSAKTPPSVFVRDAIVQRAREFTKSVKGAGHDG